MPKYQSHPKGVPGFTLIELMVTVVVAAILLALATPSFADFIDRYRLRGVTDDVVNFVNNARAESVKQGRDVNVAFKGTTSVWCIGANAAAEPTNAGDAIPAAAACDCSTDATSCKVGGEQRVFGTDSDNGVVLSAVPADFTFDNRLGTVSPLGTTTVTLTSPRKRFDLQLTVTALGQASLCVPSGKRAITGVPSC
jgi:prepilin-type N-terminal cleavage/methylation domain-containing protein